MIHFKERDYTFRSVLNRMLPILIVNALQVISFKYFVRVLMHFEVIH